MVLGDPGKDLEAEFEQDGKEYEVEITVTGHYLLTEIEIPVEELPDHIREKVSLDFPDCRIDEVSIVNYSNGDMAYEIDLEKPIEGEKDEMLEFEVHYREDGVFIAGDFDM